MINQGQAPVLLGLLNRFNLGEFATELQARVHLALAQIYNLRNDKQPARENYVLAYEEAQRANRSEAKHDLVARISDGMGELLEMDAPQEALDWLRRGIDELAEEDGQLLASLEIHSGYLKMMLGELRDAPEVVERGLQRLAEGPSQLRGAADLLLGTIQSAQGDHAGAQAYTLRGLEISEQMHDPYQTVAGLTNLAGDEFGAGQWQAAIEDFQKAASLSEEIGHAKWRRPGDEPRRGPDVHR